jgi:hypothetical protein
VCAAIPNISVSRLQTLYTAKLAMLSRLQDAFDQAGRGGVVFGNGLSEYNQSPTDPHNRRILSATRGIQNEVRSVMFLGARPDMYLTRKYLTRSETPLQHFAAFEQVDSKTGELRKDKVSNVLDQIEWASTVNGSSKQVGISRIYHLPRFG